MVWWYWLVLGSILFAAELVAIDAQFYLIFIGISAAIVGLLGWVGIDMSATMQWFVFAALSLISMFTFRKSLYLKLQHSLPGHVEGVDGDYVVIQEELAANGRGRVKLRGTEWNVINRGSNSIKAGSRVAIAKREGLTLIVNSDNS